MNSKVRFADVLDGTANTIHYIEFAHWARRSWTARNTGTNQFIWVHHTSQGYADSARPPNDQTPNTRSAVSSHTGGVQGTMVDGSVQFISNHIDMPVYRALFTRALGEVAQLPN
jgi:hypothetical protein